MTALSYSDRYDRLDIVHQSITVSQILSVLKRYPPFTPLFPLLRRLAINLSQPGWAEDLLPYISLSNLEFLAIRYNGGRYHHPRQILGFIAHLTEGGLSLRTMKLKVRGKVEPYAEFFVNSENYRNLRHITLDCHPSLSALSFSRIAHFPCLQRLTIRLKQEITKVHVNSITLPWLEKLELTVSETKFAISFFDSIEEFPRVARIFIYIEQILPFKRELEQVSHQLQHLCSPMLLRTLDISFHDSGARHTGLPPLMPENPGYTLQTFLPLVTRFSLHVFHLSVQLPLLPIFPPSSSFTAKMASAWTDLTSIRIDPGSLIPLDELATISFCDLIPFFQTCKRLRHLHIPFTHSLSDYLPHIEIQAIFLYDLGLGYLSPQSEELLALAKWLRVAMPALPEVVLRSRSGDCKIYDLFEFAEDTFSAQNDARGTSSAEVW